MEQIDKVREQLRTAQCVAIITGAGISSESGIPTFRGKEGYWKNYNPMELATPQAFRKDPKLVQQWYAWRREICANAIPNPAHQIISEWENALPDFLLITQNVDGLHKRAGQQKIIELHGNIFLSKCTSCNYTLDTTDQPEQSHPNLCPKCQSHLRPDILWFGERYDNTMQLAQVAKHTHARIININPEKSNASDLADIHLKGKAVEIFALLNA